MNLHTLMLTNNECYKAGNIITPCGIMVHSTGANNPYLKRYVGPDDGLLGKNQYNNHWNTARPDGRQICPHAFVGKLADGTIATYQTLPWTMRGWHSGSGTKGSANNLGYIGFEICEDDLTDYDYMMVTYKEAVELCAYLCAELHLSPTTIICHSEGYKLGIASNHGDVMHWWTRHGRDMDTFRADVADILTVSAITKSAPSPKTSSTKPTPKLDNEPHDWSRDAVNWAVSNGLMIGDEHGDLMLRQPITREQFVTVLHRYDNIRTAK